MQTIWTSLDGKTRSFSAMDDEHLANVILHMSYYHNRLRSTVLAEALEEYSKRNLSQAFLDAAPYPYKDTRNGVWMIWDFDLSTIRPYVGDRQPIVRFDLETFDLRF
jgi:hypothetical protein